MVAIARVQNGTIFFHKKVTVHHPYSDCQLNDKREIHQNFLKALRKLKVLKRCSKCWTDGQWDKALNLIEELLNEKP